MAAEPDSLPLARRAKGSAGGHVVPIVLPAQSCVNNKARVITKRCYGVKSVGTLFSRLILDLNRTSEAVGQSIADLRQIAAGRKAVFLGFCA